MELFDDQKDWCRATIAAFERPQESGDGPFSKVLSVAGTGFGKTIAAAAITKYTLSRWHGPAGKDQPSRVLFLADTDELVNQAQEKLYNFSEIPPDREKAADRASLNSRIVVGSVQSLQAEERLARYPRDHFAMVIADEAHLSMADGWQRVLGHFHQGGAKLLGITATPERGDDRDLWSFWEHKGAEIGLFDLIALGRLAPIRVKTLPVDLDCRGIKKSKEGLDEEQVTHAIEPAFEAIIEAWERHGENRKTLWFLPGVAASKRFADMLVERGHASRHIDGNSRGRREILAAYAANQFTHLTNSDLLIKGYDCPDIACVVNLSPGTSRVAYQQKVGRGTRVAPGKTDLLLLDFLWQFDRLAICRPVDLVARNKDEAQRMQEQLDQAARESDRGEFEAFEAKDLHDQRDLADSQLIRSLIQQLVDNTTRKTRTYDARAAAALINAPELIAYTPQADWERMPPTPKQKELLKGKGISPAQIKTRGMASRFLDVLFTRQQQGLSTFKQAARLTANGIQGANHMTFAEASAAMDRLIRQNQ